jgi:high-affinity iron transporter
MEVRIMLTIAVVAFRESMEMLIVIIALIAYVVKIEKSQLLKYIFIGSFTGLAVSVGCGALVLNQAKSLQGPSRNIFEGAMMLFLCFLILYYMVWMRGQKKFVNMDIEQKYNIRTTGIGFFIFSFLTIFRECTEVIIFMIPLFNESVLTIITGCLIGLGLSSIACYVLYRTSIKINLNILFDILTLILIYIGSIMFGEGLSLLIPYAKDSIEMAGKMIFGLPTLFIFLKGELKAYTKKNS